MQDSYSFIDLPLTPAIAEMLIQEKFAGQVATRQTIVEEVRRLHISRGGKPAEAVDLARVIKKALERLRECGTAQNPSLGYWRIGLGEGDLEEATADFPVPLTQVEDVAVVAADVILRQDAGVNSAVYLYYLPAYRISAETAKLKAWPCKIGRTERDPLSRILSQAATALPEKPHVALIIYTQYPISFEAAIHGVLTLRGQKIDDSPGKEWFLTSPDEVRALVEVFDPKLMTE